MSTTAAENHVDEDGDFRGETKYKQFSAAVERALKGFEVSTEWPDLISSLAKLNKVLLAYMQYPVVPYQLMVCKRLSQCLHPNLPGGVHLKALDVYKAIFSRIRSKGLASNLLVYSSGLFPLVGCATMSVRPSLLDIYEQYYLPLGEELLPALHGLVLGLLPGLEDESEHTERICQLLDKLCAATDQSAFFYALWQCVLNSPGSRLPAINLILSKLNRKLTVEDQVHCLGGNLLLVISALCAALTDRNVLVGRPALDITSILFPFHQPFLLPSDTTTLLSAALETLLKRDVSLNRRLYAWLLGLQVNKSYLAAHLPRSSVSSSEECSYFESYTKVHLLSALKQILSRASMAAKHSSKAESVLPYRLLRILMDKQEVGEHIVKEILLDAVSCLKQQVEILGGLGTKESNRHSQNPDRDDLPRKPVGKKSSLKAEILQSANLFFNCLSSELLWDWMGDLLSLSFGVKATSTDGEAKPSGNVKGSKESLLTEGKNRPVVVSQQKPVTLNFTEQLVSRGDVYKGSIPPCSTILELVTFLLQLLPLDSLENAHQWQLPNLLLFVLGELIRCEAVMSLEELQSSLELISFILQELLRSPSSQMSSHASTPHSLSSPHPTSRILGTLHSASTAEAVSPASPRNFLPVLESASRQMSDDGISQLHSPMSQPLEDMGAQIFADYLTFFSGFLGNKINNSNGNFESQLDRSQRTTVGRTLSKEVQTLFSAACQLLLSASKLAPETALMGTEESSALSEPPAWLAGLMSTCLGSYHEHVTFVALETLLRLLEVAHLDANRIVPDSHPTLAANLLHFITANVTFLQSVSQLLWSCLSPDCPSYHIEASTLLTWLHSLTAPSSACEMVILEDLASKGLAAYHKFAVLWQYMSSTIHQTSTRPFNRVLLRMLEGLQDKSTAVSCFVQSWVKFATERSELLPLFQPLVRILLEADTLRTRKSYVEEEEDAGSAHAKYYYNPKDVPEKEESLKEDQFSAVELHYTQVFDARQVLYAFSLLQSILAVDPAGIISSLGEVVVNTGTYASVNQTSSLATIVAMKCDSDIPQSDAPHPQKSLLELLLATCINFLRSDYPDSLEVSPTDCLDNLQVKTSAAELLSTILHEFVCILSSQFGRNEAEMGGKMSGVVSHPSYVSALVTLCDIQKIALLLSAQVVQCLRDIQSSESTKQQGGNSRDSKGETRPWNRLRAEQTALPPGFGSALRSLFVHLQKLLQKLITLDAQCSLALNPTTPVSTTAQLGAPFTKQSGKLTSQLPLIQPSLSTAAQPFFQALLLDILADPSLVHLHGTLLSMFTAILPNLLNQLDELAPKVLKQICKNLEMILQSTKATEPAHPGTENDKMCPISSKLFSGELAVSYMETLVAVVLWCYFSDGQVICPPKLSQHAPSMFWKVNTVSELEHTGDSLSPLLKQPSTMSWLFGVFSTSSQKGMALSDVGTKNPCVGINSKVGQYILMLLPAVYNAVTEIWRYFHTSAIATATRGSQKGVVSHSLDFELDGGTAVERKRRMEFEDVRQLISWLLCPLAERESSAFFSSISHIWLEWNLEARVLASKRLSKKKESFIEMLHQIKVLPLERFIRCVQFTVNDITRQEDFESGVLRQKYLLHFLYKYISSTLQSSEELAMCRGALVLFLRDCFTQSYNPTPQYLFSNCHIICMLTSILHVYVCRVPAPELKTQKKERKELQDVTHKLCEALSITANVGLAQDYVLVDSRSSASEEENDTSDRGEGSVIEEHGTTHVGVGKLEHPTSLPHDRDLVTSAGRSTPPSPRTGVSSSTGTVVPSEQDKVHSMSGSTRPPTSHRENEVSAGDVRAAIGKVGDQPNSIQPTSAAKKQLSYAVSNELQLPTIQALAVLSNVLSHFIDCVFGSSEKEKVHSLLKAVLSNVWPHLQNHSPESQQCYRHAVKLLSSLSEFQVTRKTWRRETFDLFLANNFFVMDTDCLKEWKVIVDNLMTQDKVTFRDLLGRVGYSSTPGVINIFSSLEHEALTGARLLKRMTFAILSGERDQYVSYLPDVQEKLSEYLKFQRHPLICAEVFLSFRVLLLKFSPQHLEAFWPAIVAELLVALGHLEKDLAAELASRTTLPREKLQFFLSACKLLDTAVALPAEFLPHFQLLQWGFQPHSGGVSASPVVTKICRHFSTVDGTRNFGRSPPSPPCLQMQAISSLRELRPLFESLHTGQQFNSTSEISNLDYAAGGAGSRLAAVEKVIFEDFLEQI